MQDKSYLFDFPATPLVYSTPGVNTDFVEHKSSDFDADLVNDELIAALFDSAPIIGLEKGLTTTGAAQLLTYDAPVVGDPSMSESVRLLGFELAIQLNDLNIPKTDFNFTVRYRNCFGDELVGSTQNITGNAAVINGNTRQFIRLLQFSRNGKFFDGGAVTLIDGKVVQFPIFAKADPAAVAVLVGLGITNAQLRSIFRDLATDVAQIEVSIPLASMTSGVTLTLTPVTGGRKEVVSAMSNSLDKIGSVSSMPASQYDGSTKMPSA